MNVTLQEDCGIIVPGIAPPFFCLLSLLIFLTRLGQNGILFDAAHLNRAFDRSNKNRIFETKSYTPSRIYVMLDPNADNNGTASNSAVASCFWAPPTNPRIIRRDNSGIEYEREFVMPYPRLIMLGMDVSSSSSGRDKDNLVLAHIRKIRNMKQYAKVPIIYVPVSSSKNDYLC